MRLRLNKSITAWGDNPNISKLFKQITQREILLSYFDKPTKKQSLLIKEAIALIQNRVNLVFKTLLTGRFLLFKNLNLLLINIINSY